MTVAVPTDTRVHGRFRAELAGPRPRGGGDIDGQHARTRAAAIMTADSPTPPQPCTATHSLAPHPAVRP